MTMQEYAIERGKTLQSVLGQAYEYRYLESKHNFIYILLQDKELLFNINDDIKIISMGFYLNRFDRKLSIFIERIIDYKTINNADDKISSYLKVMLKSNMLKIKETLLKEYNSIDNYDSFEKETISQKYTTSDFNYGFSNPNNPKNVSKSVNEGLADDNIRILERSGNIGTTKTQEMINDEIKLRLNNYYYDILFKQIDKIIFSKILN